MNDEEGMTTAEAPAGMATGAEPYAEEAATAVSTTDEAATAADAECAAGMT